MDKRYLLLVFIFLALWVENSLTDDPDQCNSFDIHNPCQCVFKNGSIIDFSQDGYTNGTARFSHQLFNVTGPKDGAMISFNPCFPFSDDAEDNVYINLEPKCRDTMGCYYTRLNDSALDVQVRTGFGKLDKADFFVHQESKRIGIKYFTPFLGGQKTNNLTVLFKCAQEKETEPKISATVDKLSDITVEYSSRCACPNGCARKNPPSSASDGGLSTGSILVILFFAFLVVYILGGITVNVLLRGASGREVLPHYEFWSNLPGLIGDGACFVCSCCCTKTPSRSAYDDVS